MSPPGPFDLVFERTEQGSAATIHRRGALARGPGLDPASVPLVVQSGEVATSARRICSRLRAAQSVTVIGALLLMAPAYAGQQSDRGLLLGLGVAGGSSSFDDETSDRVRLTTTPMIGVLAGYRIAASWAIELIHHEGRIMRFEAQAQHRFTALQGEFNPTHRLRFGLGLGRASLWVAPSEHGDGLDRSGFEVHASVGGYFARGRAGGLRGGATVIHARYDDGWAMIVAVGLEGVLRFSVEPEPRPSPLHWKAR